MCADGLATYTAAAEASLAREGDAWEAFAGFLTHVVEADTHSLTLRLGGTFAPTEELYRAATCTDNLVGASCDARLMPLKVGEVIKLIEDDGWYLVATRGSHRQYKHPTKPGRVTVPGKPSRELYQELERSILKQAGLSRRSK